MKYLKIWLICIPVLTCFNAMAQPVKKQDVKVLFVGSPIEEKGARFPAFKNYLELHFTKVKAIGAKEYKAEMSADYDVTIFDTVIAPFAKRRQTRRDDGTVLIDPDRYLTEDFDDAIIFIGQTIDMGASIGLKVDRLCHCLYSEAHHIKIDHPIFKGPFNVKLTFENKPTPKHIFHYASGQKVPKQIPMWRVQSDIYAEKSGQLFRIGMVSNGDGFLDSPDTEYISSGINTKDVGAVAIGRHGNFFMWGFSGSPDYMTDEAKQVFANTVVYMKQFKGKKPVARKYKWLPVRDVQVDEILFKLSKEQYKLHLKEEKKRNKRLKSPTPLPDWEQYLKQFNRFIDFFKEEYVNNIEVFRNYLKENKEYMYVPEGRRSLKVDEDAKQLGISNRDIKILYKAVELLEKGQQSDLANRILNRYTREHFSSPTEWKQWLDKNKKDLFFTDAGGYVWLVNKINT